MPVVACKVFCNYKSSLNLGWRVSMEDAHIANINLGEDIYIFGVFDGHGGTRRILIEF